ncbi:MAG: MBL fold metallo-hydrolase [Balneolaceae bacterium]
MKIGRFHIEQLSEGFFEIHSRGKICKVDPEWMTRTTPEESEKHPFHRIGIDPILVTDGHHIILVDPGLGWGLDHRSKWHNTSNVVTNLEIFDIQPDQVNFVILTHLHYDHSAGCSYVDSSLKTCPTFPNATYMVQREEWEYALTLQAEKAVSDDSGGEYRLDELYKLVAEERVHFIEQKETELIPGVALIRTGGHTPGHQVVRITDGAREAWCPGDLIPSELNLNRGALNRYHTDPVSASKFKGSILEEACRNQSWLLFYHSMFQKTGRLALDKKRNYILLEEARNR